MAIDFELTAAAQVERSKLRKHFGRFDIFFFLICTLVGVDTIASVARGGGQALTWMIVLAVVFFVPQALLFAELGTTFPQEGGEYLWTRLAFGHLAGAVNNFLYWITNPVWIGGTLALSAIAGMEIFWNHGNNFSTAGFIIVGLIFIWITVTGAIVSFSYGKWIPTVGAFARFLLLGLFSVSVIAFAIEHGVHGLGAGSYKPNSTGFVLLIGVLLFNYVGFELPNSAGDEMTNPQRDVPFAIMRSAVLTVVLYAVPVLGILVVLPPSAISGFSGFANAFHNVFSVWGGSLQHGTLTGAGAVLGNACLLGYIVCLITSGTTWIMGADRSLAVSGYDGAAPRSLGVISERFGTPVRVNILSGVVATAFLLAVHYISSGNAAKFFSVALGITVSTTLISYLLIYPAAWQLRRSHPEVPRPYRMPAHRALTVVLMILLVISVIELIAPGFGAGLFASHAGFFTSAFRVSGWTYAQRWTYLLVELIPVLFLILVGVAFYFSGASTRRDVVAASAQASLQPEFD